MAVGWVDRATAGRSVCCVLGRACWARQHTGHARNKNAEDGPCMNAQGGGSQSEESGDVVTLELRCCPVCDTTFPVTVQSTFCPVCMLRLALASADEPAVLHRERAGSTPSIETQTFENYELITNDQGQPVELGRGAMGVT